MKRPKKRYASREKLIAEIDKATEQAREHQEIANQYDAKGDELRTWLNEHDCQTNEWGQNYAALTNCRELAKRHHGSYARIQQQLKKLGETLAGFDTMPMAVILGEDESVQAH